MGTMEDDSYKSHFKAKVAMETVGNENTISEIAEKYAVKPDLIKTWGQQLKEQAEFMFGKKAESAIEMQDHPALLRTILEASPNGILVTDLNRKVITYNKRCAQMWEIPVEVAENGDMNVAIEQALRLVKHPEKFKLQIDDIRANPEKEIKMEIALKDGRFFERRAVPFRVEGEIIGRITHFIDITKYKQSESKASQFGNLLSSVNTNVNEGILRSTPSKGLIYVNDAFVEIFGYDSKEEVLETNPVAFYKKGENRKKLLKKLELNGGFKNEEVLYKRKDGSTFWGLENSTLIKENGQTFIDGVVTDIENWKKAEKALRKSENKYRSILKDMQEGYYETNFKGDFTFFNTALVDIMKYDSNKLLGMNYREFMDDENAKITFEKFNRIFTTGQSDRIYGIKLYCGNHSHIFVDSSLTLRKDADGTPVGFSGVIRDVTEQKRKRKQLQESLKEKEVLLGEIHHRVKNNLAVISGLLYLQAEQTNDEKANKTLKESQNRINSIALVHELLYNKGTFSSLNPRKYINMLIQHLAENLNNANVDIKTQIETDNFDLKMNTAIPCALIINELITNAFKYAFSGMREGQIKIIFKKDKGTYMLEIIDNGKGLPAGFDIADSKQHNLGLSLVKTLTNQLNGTLQVKNDEGSRFMITFSEAD